MALAIYVYSGLYGYIVDYIGANFLNTFAIYNMIPSFIAGIISLYCRYRMHNGIAIRMKCFLLMCLVTVVYFISYLGFRSNYTPIQFIYYIVVALVIITLEFDIELFLRVVTIGACLLLPFYGKLFEIYYISLHQANMNIMYRVFNVVLAALLHFIYYRKQSPKWMWIFYTANMVLLIGLITCANRGVILCIFFSALFVYLNRSQKFQQKVIRKYNIRPLIVLIIIFLLYYNFINLVNGLVSIIGSFTSNVPGFLVKLNRYILLNDVSNGRDEITSFSINMLLDNPFSFIGIGNFGNYYPGTDITYPHNFILQFWIEGGIILGICSGIITWYPGVKLFSGKIKNKELCITTLYLFLLFIPRFFVSLNVWTYYEIWLGLFYMVNYWEDIKKA